MLYLGELEFSKTALIRHCDGPLLQPWDSAVYLGRVAAMSDELATGHLIKAAETLVKKSAILE